MILDLNKVSPTDFRKIAIKNFDNGIDTYGYSEEAFPQFSVLDNTDFVESSLTHRDGKTVYYNIGNKPDSYGIIAGSPNRLWVTYGNTVSAFNSGINAAPTVLTSTILQNTHGKKAIVSAKIPDWWSTPVLSSTTTNTVAYTYKLEDSTKTWTINQYAGYCVSFGNVGVWNYPVAKIASNTATELWFESDIPLPTNGLSYHIRRIIDGVIVTDPSATLVDRSIQLKDIANEKYISSEVFRAGYCSLAVPYRDRIFYAGIIQTGLAEGTNYIFWSERGLGSIVYGQSYLEVGSAGNTIYELKEVNGMLCIFTAQGIFVLKGNDEATFTLRKLSSISPVSAGAVAYGSNTVYFWAYDGVRRFTGYESLDLKPEFPLTEAIQQDISLFTANELAGMKSFIYNNKFIAQVGAKRYVLNLKESRKNNKPSWTTETTNLSDLQAVAHMFVLQETTVGADIPVTISNTGVLYRDYYGQDDAGTAIVVTIQSNNINLNEEGVDKRVDTVKILYQKTSKTFNWVVYVSYDNAGFSSIGTTDAYTDTMPKDIIVRSSYCSSFAIKFVGTVPTSLWQYGSTTKKPILLAQVSAFYTIKSANLHTNK